MKKNLALQMIIILMLSFSFACNSYKNEKQLSVSASEAFYKNYNEKNFQQIADDQIDSTFNSARKDKMLEKLKTFKDILGNINNKELEKIDAKSFEQDSVLVFCNYRLQSENGNYYQRVIWRVNGEKPVLSDVLTYSYNEKGEVQLLVIEGKLIY